jgi:hypothetical protein
MPVRGVAGGSTKAAMVRTKQKKEKILWEPERGNGGRWGRTFYNRIL